LEENRPLVSIGVPVYNGANYILDTLNCINQQSYPHIELIIVDDFSSDSSYEICCEWASKCHFPVSVSRNEYNKGLPSTCNIILSKARGKYLQIFGQDDCMLTRKITDDVNLFEGLNEDVAFVYSEMKLINEAGDLINETYNQRIGYDGKIPADFFKELIHKNFIPAPTVLMRLSALKKIGGYDESLFFEDWDIWLKLAKEFKVVFNHVANVHYRIHSGSMMANNDREIRIQRNQASIRMLWKHLGYSSIYDELLYKKLRDLFIYSYYLGDKTAAENFSLYLKHKFDGKIWVYHKLARLGIKHPAAKKYSKFILLQ
jgi:glycosyltransferase involved in cell wall biosynthesis